MSAFLIADLTIKDAAAFADYVKLAGPLIEKYGGRVVARSDAPTALEGAAPQHFVIIRFDTADAARRFYDSEDYREPRERRLGGIATGRVFLVDGV